jgi:hypothetical protein
MTNGTAITIIERGLNEVVAGTVTSHLIIRMRQALAHLKGQVISDDNHSD